MRTLYLKHCKVLDPEIDAAPLVVVYPGWPQTDKSGKSWADAGWMVNTILNPLSLKLLFVVPNNYDEKCGPCVEEAEKTVGKDKISSYSLCGFSRGGICVYQYKDVKPWKIYGLIDPSAPTMWKGLDDTVLDNVSPKIRCVYREANWSKSDHFQSIKSFHKHLKDIGVKMVDDDKQTVSHPEMPTLFFNTFGKDF